jgi:hypothetical protein
MQDKRVSDRPRMHSRSRRQCLVPSVPPGPAIKHFANLVHPDHTSVDHVVDGHRPPNRGLLFEFVIQ